MWFNALFRPEDKMVVDSCPVCQEEFGSAYFRIERIYYCSDCKKVVMFHPYELTSKMFLLKKTSRMDQNYTPCQEDQWRGGSQPTGGLDGPPQSL